MLELVMSICDREFKFDDFEKCRTYFKELINALRQMNYSVFKSDRFNEYENKLNNLLSNGK